jgi:hypothetical protein
MGKNDSVGPPGAFSRADLLLVLIPLSFIVIYGTGVLALDSQLVPLLGATLTCYFLIAYGLFWHPPHTS